MDMPGREAPRVNFERIVIVFEGTKLLIPAGTTIPLQQWSDGLLSVSNLQRLDTREQSRCTVNLVRKEHPCDQVAEEHDGSACRQQTQHCAHSPSHVNGTPPRLSLFPSSAESLAPDLFECIGQGKAFGVKS